MNVGAIVAGRRHGNRQRALPGTKTHIWQDDAVCNQVDPDLFFPKGGAKASYDKAIKLCADCPVWRDCLEFGMQSKSEYGMFGGASPADRKAIREGTYSVEDFEPGHGGMRGTAAGFRREKRSGLYPCDECTTANNQDGYARKAASKEKVA